MKPAPFVYVAPSSIGDAVEMVGSYGRDGKVLAGGQSLVPMLNMRIVRPAALIDISRVAQLGVIRHEDRIRLGAGTRMAAALADERLGTAFPLLHEALRNVGSTAIRSRGTLGGSLAHADPAAELPATMLVLGADLVVEGPRGERVVPADEFFVGRGATAMGPDELLTEIHLPAAPPSTWGFQEVARRRGDLPLAGVVCAAQSDPHNVVRSARLVLFGVADRPVRARAAEEVLVGRSLAEAGLVDAVAELVTEGIEVVPDDRVPVVYRREAATALARRALEDVVTRVRS